MQKNDVFAVLARPNVQGPRVDITALEADAAADHGRIPDLVQAAADLYNGGWLTYSRALDYIVNAARMARLPVAGVAWLAYAHTFKASPTVFAKRLDGPIASSASVVILDAHPVLADALRRMIGKLAVVREQNRGVHKIVILFPLESWPHVLESWPHVMDALSRLGLQTPPFPFSSEVES